MKKRLSSMLLVLVMMLGMLPATALAASSEAEALGEVSIYNGGQKLSYLSINGRVRELIYTYFNYMGENGKTKEIPAYCVNPNTKGVPQTVASGQSIKYLAEEKGNDPKVMGIIANGYPTRGLAELKLENKYHAYYATKMALWCYLLPNWNIIDRCTANIYHDFIKSGGEGQIPTLPDWRNEVKRQPEREAQELALASELFVEGSLNMFAHETNFDIDNRIICFDLYEMGEQLKPTALNVVLETIQNRVAANRLAGRYTWVFVDEVYLFFKYYYSAQFLYKCWKRFRKYAAAMTAATQNIEECLHSETARLMLANSEFLILLNQAATDRAELAKLLHISETQMSHVTNVEAGHGLMRIGSSIIPFVNEFPRDGALYRLMTTTPGDK